MKYVWYFYLKQFQIFVIYKYMYAWYSSVFYSFFWKFVRINKCLYLKILMNLIVLVLKAVYFTVYLSDEMMFVLYLQCKKLIHVPLRLSFHS